MKVPPASGSSGRLWRERESVCPLFVGMLDRHAGSRTVCSTPYASVPGDEIQAIEGVISVTSYLVTGIKYESSFNIAGLLDGVNPEPDSRRRSR